MESMTKQVIFVAVLATASFAQLDVETIIPIHYPADGRKVTMAEFLKSVGKEN